MLLLVLVYEVELLENMDRMRKANSALCAA